MFSFKLTSLERISVVWVLAILFNIGLNSDFAIEYFSRLDTTKNVEAVEICLDGFFNQAKSDSKAFSSGISVSFLNNLDSSSKLVALKSFKHLEVDSRACLSFKVTSLLSKFNLNSKLSRAPPLNLYFI